MSKLKTLAVTAIATLAIGAGGLAAAPSASAKQIDCDRALAWLKLGNQALADGRYNAAWNFFERATENIKFC